MNLIQAEDHRKRVEQLIAHMKKNGQLCFSVALGNYFTGLGSIACSYRMSAPRCWSVSNGGQRAAAIFIRI